MSDSRPTLADLFSIDDKTLENLNSRDEIISLHESTDEQAKEIEWPIILDEVKDKVGDLLDIDIADIFLGAWKKAKMLDQYLDKKKYPPGESALVSLVKHSIKSDHHPYIEMVINDVAVGKVHFDIGVEFSLEGATLKVQDGKVMSIAVGTCTGKGKLGLQGAALIEEKTKPIKLPGTIDLGEGFAIAG